MKISQVLIDSQNTRKQTTGNLVRTWNNKTGEPQNYCALGALACEKGMINNIHDIGDIVYEEILMSYNIKNVYIDAPMPKKHFFSKGREGTLLSTMIWRLNDDYKWSFKKIGKYLKKLEDEGIILYND